MCLKGCSILVLPCTILIALVAIALSLLIEADRQGVEIPAATPWVAPPLRHVSERLGELLHSPSDSPSDEERIMSLLEFLDSAPLCSMVPVHEIDTCAEWAGCMLASGMDNTDGQNAARVDYVQAIHNESPVWQDKTWKVNLCGKEFTAAQDTWTASARPLHAAAEQPAVEYRPASNDELRDRASKIKEACMRAWRAYQKLAWGSDELLPVSRIGHRFRGDGLGMFLVDAMETLHLLGEQEAFDYAVAWVAGNSSGMPGAFNQAMNLDANSGTWPTAEVVTHVVGGLLSSYQLSGYDALLDAAERVAGRLESAFQTESGLPLQQCDLSRGVCHRPESYPHNPRGDATVEETWAVGLELAMLAHVSHRVEHWRHSLEQKVAAASRRMLEAIDKRAANARIRLGRDNDAEDSLVGTHGAYARLMMQTEDTAAAYGLPGSLIDPDSGEWASDARHTVAYGARHGASAERYYTGLLHQYLWWNAVASTPTNSDVTTSGRSGVTREEATLLAQQCKKRYQSAIEGLRRLLVRRSTGKHKLWYIGELLQGRQFLPAFSSTSCGLSGTLALGHINGMDDDDGSHLKLAQDLAESCVRIGQLTASGLPPDVTWLNGRPKAHEDAVEWFASDEDSQQLHAVNSHTQEDEHASRRHSIQFRVESAEVVVVRDESGSSSCTGGPALAQSLYWLYRATKQPKYVEWAWAHFEALEQSSRLPRKDAGYASVMDVTNSSSSHHDEMKGWLLTTFKWVWLLQNEARKIDGKPETSVPPSRDVISSTAGHLLMPWLE